MRNLAKIACFGAAIMTASAAQAADLGTGRGWGNSNNSVAPMTGYSWTGFYAGGHLGAGFGSANSANMSGFLIGAQAGYNYQFDRFVIGGEGDVSFSGVSHRGFADKFNERWLGSLRGRLGYTFDRFMVFGTGGFAMGTGEFKNFTGKATNNHMGYALGLGAEMKITNAISARVEYLHYGLGEKNYTTLAAPVRIDSSTNIIRGGLNYHF